MNAGQAHWARESGTKGSGRVAQGPSTGHFDMTLLVTYSLHSRSFQPPPPFIYSFMYGWIYLFPSCWAETLARRHPAIRPAKSDRAPTPCQSARLGSPAAPICRGWGCSDLPQHYRWRGPPVGWISKCWRLMREGGLASAAHCTSRGRAAPAAPRGLCRAREEPGRTVGGWKGLSTSPPPPGAPWMPPLSSRGLIRETLTAIFDVSSIKSL